MAEKSTISFVMTLVPFLKLRKSKFSLTKPFSPFYNWIRLVADVRTIEDGLHALPETASSGDMAFEPEISVPISVFQRVASKFRVVNYFGGVFKATDIMAAFFHVRAVSSVLCLWTAFKPSSWMICCPVDFGALACPAWVLTLSMAFNSLNVTVYTVARSV
jgi:hypothetical protein